MATDPATRAIIDLLVEAMPCAFIARPAFYPLITLKAVNLSLLYGNTEADRASLTAITRWCWFSIGDTSAVQFSKCPCA